MTDGPVVIARSGRGLRSRLIGGFVWVALATALVTAATAITGALVIFSSHPVGTSRVGNEFFDAIPLRDASDRTVVIILVIAALGLLALSVGAGLLVARRLLRPVRELADAAERVALGDLSVRLQPNGDDELADLANGFNSMTTNLASSMDELRRLEAQARRFASDVSHELRSPLAAMTAVTEVLATGSANLSGDAARALHLVVQEISHLDRLVTDLIEMSRFDAGTVTLDTEVVRISTAVNACLTLRGWADLVQTDVDPDLEGLLDRRRFDVILANLVGNAVKYARAPIVVTAGVVAANVTAGVVAAPGGPRLLLTVADNGPGLSPASLPHVFERFYKADAARARSDGSGLGLAIALENARLHGGTITAVNRPEGGAVFSLVLPLYLPSVVFAP